jgi:hypothetical protein
MLIFMSIFRKLFSDVDHVLLYTPSNLKGYRNDFQQVFYDHGIFGLGATLSKGIWGVFSRPGVIYVNILGELEEISVFQPLIIY